MNSKKYPELTNPSEENRRIINEIQDEIALDEINCIKIESLDNNLLEKISGLAYFEEFIGGDLLEKSWKMGDKRLKNEDFVRNLTISDECNGRFSAKNEQNSRIEAVLEREEQWKLKNRPYCPKDWRDFK